MHIDTVNIHVHSAPSTAAHAFIEALLRALRAEKSAASEAPATTPAANSIPRIGELWPEQGGIYAGVSRGEDGGPDAHIVLLAAKPDSELNWADAIQWAKGLGNGARLPTRFESALLYAHLRDQFSTDSYHWTGTQSSAVSAWDQYFGHGDQNGSFKKSSALCRAVRRFVI